MAHNFIIILADKYYSQIINIQPNQADMYYFIIHINQLAVNLDELVNE